MKKLWFVLAVFVGLAGFQSTQAAESKDGKSYSTVADGVRSVTLMDKKGGVIGKRLEQFDHELEEWFEAEKVSGNYALTNKGYSDKSDSIELRTPGDC